MQIKNNGNVYFLYKDRSFDEFISLIQNSKENGMKIYDSRMFGHITFNYNGEREFFIYDDIPKTDIRYQYVQRMLDAVDELGKDKRKKDLLRNAVNNGNIPEDERDKRWLLESIDEEIEDTKATYVNTKKSKVASLATAVVGAVVLTGGVMLTGDNSLLCAATAVGASTLSLWSAVNYLDYKLGEAQLEGNMKYYQGLARKVKGRDDDLVLDEVEKIEYENKLKLKKYNDKFIDEVARLADLINKLPEHRREEYRSRVKGIIDIYQERINKILDNNDNINLGKATDAYTLLIEMLPSLFKIEREVVIALGVETKRKSINDEIEEVRSLLQGEDEPLKRAA